MVRKRGLGKSLDALLSYAPLETENLSLSEINTELSDKITTLPIAQIQSGKYQPRRHTNPEALQELALSIRSQGIIQPIIVRPIGDQYEIIAGERRWRAAQLAELTEVPVIIRHVPDEAASAIALIENIQREDLNPVEEAMALQRLIDEFAMTHQEVADAVGKSRASVTNLLRLLALPETIKEMLDREVLEMGHARTLLTLPPALQVETAEIIANRKLSVRETENLVRRLQTPSRPNEQEPDPDIVHLQEKLAHQLKLRVAIHCTAKGKGKLIIHYRNLAELNNLLAQFDMACIDV